MGLHTYKHVRTDAQVMRANMHEHDIPKCNTLSCHHADTNLIKTRVQKFGRYDIDDR